MKFRIKTKNAVVNSATQFPKKRFPSVSSSQRPSASVGVQVNNGIYYFFRDFNLDYDEGFRG